MSRDKLDLSYELEKRLGNWQHWMLGGSGFPPKSILADFGLFTGTKGTPASKPPIPMTNLEAQELNSWINIMSIGHPEFKRAIRSYYLEKGTSSEKAVRLNISERTFKEQLRCARNWLEGRLSFEDKKLSPSNDNVIAIVRPGM